MRVLCNLPNAGETINQVRFERTDGGMLSESIAPEVAAQFAGIPGYTLIEEAAPELEPEPKPQAIMAAPLSSAVRAAAELERRRRKEGAAASA